ncbi:MAG: hypothetical protein ACR2GX_04800 [Candidatus Dormibacteria bacterium]
MSEPSPSAADTEQRPTSILAVYAWDSLLALFAILGALLPFGSSIDIGGGRGADVPVIVQVLLGLQGAAYAAAVIIVMIFLTRRLAWVRQAQMAVLGLAILLAVVSIGVRALVHHDVDQSQALSNLVFVLVDVLMLFIMTAEKLRAWYAGPGPMPSWVRATIALWAAGGVAVVVATALT